MKTHYYAFFIMKGMTFHNKKEIHLLKNNGHQVVQVLI